MLKPDALFFNRSFYPDLEATGQLLTELCEDLSHSLKVCVIAGNCYHTKNRTSFLPFFKETHKGISIMRTNNTTFSKDRFLGRIINLGSYFLYALIGGFFIRPRVIIAETDPPMIGLVGLLHSKIHRVPFIYYCQDVHPDTGVITKNPMVIAFIDRVNRLIIRNAQRIVVLGRDMKEKVFAKGGVDGNIEVIPNWIDTTSVVPVERQHNPFRKKYNLMEKFVVMHSGNIGTAQNLEILLDAAASLRREKGIYFLIVGEGSKKRELMKKAKDYKLNNFMFLSYQPKDELKYSLNAGDLHLVTLRKGLAGSIVPSKVYGIMAAGRPFVASIDRKSEVAYVAKEFNCGIITEPENVEELIKAIIWSFEHPKELERMGKNGRKAVVENFDRSIAYAKWRNLLGQVLKLEAFL